MDDGNIYLPRATKGKKFTRKGRSLGHVIVFGMKPRSLNFASASTMASATPWLKISPEKDMVSVT